ncbi:MAG: DUF3078 domain-containing protein [Prevotellaceae bacterium]|nr:DUF3078 domain-containing protein [Candidatus Minthosoma equi]
MKINAYIISFCCMFVASAEAGAQVSSKTAYSRKAAAVVAAFQDSLKAASERAKMLYSENDSNDVLQDVTFSPYMYRLFGPGVYYSDAMANKLSLDYHLPWNMVGSLPYSSGMAQRNDYNESINLLLAQTYLDNPSSFRFHENKINSESIIAQTAVSGAKVEDLNEIYNKVEEIKDVSEVVNDVDVDIQIVKPNFWKTSGKFSLQFTQNYFSEKWYKGGDNNMTLFSNLILEANYNDQNKIQWDNKLDLRLGYVTTKSDKYHRYLSNNDKIALYSKIGVKAAKSWFYTVSAEANSQFMPGYRANKKERFSDFLAPLDAFMSIGMDYKPAMKNGNTLSVTLLPLSYKMRYIGADDDNETSAIHAAYNQPSDFKQDFGSKLEFNAKIKLAKSLTWRSRLYYFTSYEYTEGECENVFSYQFNKYFSTELNTLWRFDDNRGMNFKDDNLGYFQFKELFTFGLSYNF